MPICNFNSITPKPATPFTSASTLSRLSRRCGRAVSKSFASPAPRRIAELICCAPILAANSMKRRARVSRRSAGDYDIVFVIADGLSARAISSHAIALLDEALPAFQQGSWKLAPVVVVEQGRVAIGDEIGEILGAKLVAVLIGERPGLSSPDSLGVYLTFAPHVGRNDAERNCLSNIRSQGMSYSEAAQRLFYLCGEARRRKLTGVELKDETPLARRDDQSPRLGAPER